MFDWSIHMLKMTSPTPPQIYNISEIDTVEYVFFQRYVHKIPHRDVSQRNPIPSTPGWPLNPWIFGFQPRQSHGIQGAKLASTGRHPRCTQQVPMRCCGLESLERCDAWRNGEMVIALPRMASWWFMVITVITMTSKCKYWVSFFFQECLGCLIRYGLPIYN